MRKLIFLFKASYPVFILFLLNTFATHLAHGQGMAPYNSSAQCELLYGVFLSFCDSSSITGIYPEARINSGKIFPGQCLRFADPGSAITGNISGTNGDNNDTTAIADADTFDAKEPVAATPGPAPVTDNANGVTNTTSHATVDLSASVFDAETDMLISKYAEMISVAPDEVNNFHLYKFIDQWYGVKYKFGGTDNNGIDCSAFSQRLYNSIYSLNILRTARQQHRSCEIIKNYEDANEGDLVFFRIHHLGISHVGVYLANGYFVHASRSHGVVISSLNEKYWRRRYAGCGKVEREDLSGTESGFLQ